MNGVAPIYFELQTDGNGNYYIVISAMPKGDKPLTQQTKKDHLIYSSTSLDAAAESNAGAVSASAKNVGAESRGGISTSDKSGDLDTSTISPEEAESKENPLHEDEQTALKGLSADAKDVYRLVRDKLADSSNKKVARAASVGAVLLARHADIIARKIRTALGKPFTAMDYYRTWFDLQYGGEADGFTQTTAARRLKEDMLAWKQKVDDFFAGKLPLHNNVVMHSPLVFDLIGADSTLNIAIDSNILQKLVDKHHFTRKDLLALPKKIADPLFVLRAIDTKTGVEDTQKRIVVVDMEINGATVMIPFVVNTAQGMNKIASAYGRETVSGLPNDQWYIDRLNPKNLLYINKNRTARWVATRTGAAGRHNAPLTKQSFSTISIADENDLSKLKKVNSGFYQMFWTESENFNHRVVDIQFIEVDEKQALKSPNIGIRHDDNVYQLGDELENSHDWPEGNWTETELDGACAIDVADAYSYDSLDELKETAIRRLNDSNEYLNENVYLISGTSHEYGNDPNEVILRNPEVIGILKLVRWDELSEEEQEQYRKRQEEMSDEEAAEVDEVDEEHNKGLKFTYDGKDAGELSGDILEALEILDRQPKAHDTESLREKYRERLVSGERTVEFDKKQLANVNKAISILESAPNTTKEEFEKEFGPDSDIMMTIKYPSSDGLSADLAYEKEGIQKSINMDQHRVDVLKKIDPNKLQWKASETETFNQQMNEIIKGTTQDIPNGQRIISLFEAADESTFLHEMGHLFLLDLEHLAPMSPTAEKDLATVKKWAEWREGQAAEYKGTPFARSFAELDKKIRAALSAGNDRRADNLKRQWEHERFARGFEMYLKTGDAATKGLRAVFAKFRAFLQRVYQAFTGTGGKATPEVEEVMARMISIEDSSDLSAYPRGKETEVYTDSGKSIPVQYCVVSADDLIASHDANALEINPGYPSALQPRDRERVVMRQQVERMSNTLRPEELGEGRNLNQGAPLIRSDGVVLNGNGRTIAIARAQARNKECAAAYRDYLMENAETFGLSREAVARVDNPVLVREVQGDISADTMNDIIGSMTGGSRMGASENAQADADKLTHTVMDTYVPNEKGDLTTAANRDFVAGVLHKVVGQGELNAYLDKDGHVNADGIQRVKRALFAAAYGDDEIVAKMAESTDDDTRNVSNGLMAAAPMMARLSVKKGVPYVKELQDAIGAAVKQLDALRASGESVKDYLGAQALFSEHEDSAEMRAILSFLDENKRSGKRIGNYFTHIAESLDGMENPTDSDLFETQLPSLMDVLEEAKAHAETGGQKSLFGDNAQEVTDKNTQLESLLDAHNSTEKGGQDALFDEYIVKEANTLYDRAAKKFPEITNKEVADHVREAIQLTLDFGQGNGEIKAVGRGILGGEKLSSHRDVGHTDDYRSSKSLRKKSEKELKRGKIYGLGITRKLVNDGAVSLVGQTAKSAADLAEIAQVLRHHGYEKFHYVYVDDAGNVKFHETVTARLPANAPIFLPEDVHQGKNSGDYLENAKRRIIDNMRRFGASKFYLIHNHPSGDPTPSKEDFDVTRALVDLKNTTLTSSFGGHIVLDHNKYAVIDGDMNSAQHVLKNQYKEDYYFPEKAHPALGVNVASEDVTQNIADMYGTEAETTAFYLTSKNVVRSVQKIHDNFKDVDEKTQMNYLRYCARNVGGFRVVLVTSNKGLYDSIKDRINSGRDDGILDVVLMKDGRALYPEEKYRANKTPSWLGQEYRNVSVEQVLEKKTHYGSDSSTLTVDTLLQSSPALKKAALEYGAKNENGKVTFADAAQEKEFLQVAKALLNAGARKFSKAWTGSAADYDAPSLDYVGTGTGGAAYGYGLYYAEKRKTAEGYGDKLYHAEIPDADVLLDAGKSFDEQPPKVRKALEKLVRGLTLEQLENWNDVRRMGKAKVVAEIMDALSEADGTNIYGTISDLAEGQKEASELLNKYGVKGAVYNDEQNGRTFVVFDDKAIKILEKFSARRQEEIKKMLDGIALVSPNRLSPRKRALRDWGHEMGVPVVFFKGDPSLHGFHSDGVTFLNVDSEITPQWTFWHEAMHWMKANNPDLYNDIVHEISGAEGFTKEQLDAYRKEIGAEHMSDADVIEEMIADALPDVRRRVPLLRDVGKRDTGIVERLVAWVHDVMRRFHDHFFTPKGGLTNDQRRAMVRAFGNLVGSIRDADGKQIFRVANDGARITLRDGKPLPAVKYSLDNKAGAGDNKSNVGLTSAQKDIVCANVLARMKARVQDMLKRDISWDEIHKEMDDENSTSREEALRVFKTQWNIFNSPRVNRRNVVERITKNHNFSDEEVNELFDRYKAKMKEMLDYGGFIYKEAALQQRGDRGFLTGVHSWRSLERANREHGGSAHTGNEEKLNNENRSDNQDGFSMPKFSARTNGESHVGNFRRMMDALKSGVKPSPRVEVHDGRREVTADIGVSQVKRFMKDKRLTDDEVISRRELPNGKVRITYYARSAMDIGYADYAKSVRQVAKRNPFVKALYDLASKAMHKQEKLRNDFAKALKEFEKLVKNPTDMEKVTEILWTGDATGKEYTSAELRAAGASDNVVRAYTLVRRELKKAYELLNETRMQVKTRSKVLRPEDVESYMQSHWIRPSDVLSKTQTQDGNIELTWRGGKTYETKNKLMSAEELSLMEKDENINVTRAVPANAKAYGAGMYHVGYVERIKPINNLTGYMPHFFHEWMVYEQYKDPVSKEIRYTSVGNGRTLNEAVKIGNTIAEKNKDRNYVVRPKGFDMDAGNAVVVGDMEFAQMAKKLTESTQMSLSDARTFLRESAGATLKSRHRFFGNMMKRKGAEGFDKNIMWVLAHYFNSSTRYIAMEDFKPSAISLYERCFGAFDSEPKNMTARYCKDLINDVNGNPRGVEVWLNDLIKGTWLGKRIADSYGDRAALAVNGELSTWNAITKLGLFNFASAAVNFSQFINVGAALNDYGYAAKGLMRALHPSALDEKIIEASGLLEDINLAADNGGYSQRRGGRAGTVYQKAKQFGEWTLTPFQKADTLMRKAAVLGAYYQGVEKKGMEKAPGDELSAKAIAYAQQINDDANFDYSAANAPGMLRAGSVITQQLFQFQKYPIMQFEFMYNILKNGTRGQKVRMLVPYVLFCGIGGSIPFGDLFNQLFSFILGIATGDDEDIARDIKAEILRWAGKDPVKKSVAETALYGVLAPTFGLDISGRIGMSNAFSGEFYGQKPDSVSGVVAQQLGGPMAATAINMLHQAHEGNPIEALKAVSPALGNMAQAYVGVSRTTHHRVNTRYDSAYDKIAHALGFRSVEESTNAFVTNYDYEMRTKDKHTKQDAIQSYIDDPSDANRRTLNALGITDRQVKEAKIQQERTAKERAKNGRPNTNGKNRSSQHKKEVKRETLLSATDDEE